MTVKVFLRFVHSFSQVTIRDEIVALFMNSRMNSTFFIIVKSLLFLPGISAKHRVAGGLLCTLHVRFSFLPSFIVEQLKLISIKLMQNTTYTVQFN